MKITPAQTAVLTAAQASINAAARLTQSPQARLELVLAFGFIQRVKEQPATPNGARILTIHTAEDCTSHDHQITKQ